MYKKKEYALEQSRGRVSFILLKTSKPLSQKVANLLLGINQSSTVGAWQLMQSGGEYFAAYNAHISADVDAASLFTVISAVAQSADSIEDYLTGEDKF